MKTSCDSRQRAKEEQDTVIADMTAEVLRLQGSRRCLEDDVSAAHVACETLTRDIGNAQRDCDTYELSLRRSGAEFRADVAKNEAQKEYVVQQMAAAKERASLARGATTPGRISSPSLGGGWRRFKRGSRDLRWSNQLFCRFIILFFLSYLLHR